MHTRNYENLYKPSLARASRAAVSLTLGSLAEDLQHVLLQSI